LSSLRIASGSSVCAIYPDIGGSLGSWTVEGQPMMRSASKASITARDAIGMASFPLLPFSNRIADGRFVWEGEEHRLIANMPPEPHANHGVGFQRDWSLTAQTETSVTLSLEHGGDAGWPWPFEAHQVLTVTEQSLTLAMSARNLGSKPLPLAFGHHPHFDSAGATLDFVAARVWMTDSQNLPTHAVQPRGDFDFSAPSLVSGRDIDNCYADWNGAASITWEDRAFAVDIRASPSLPAVVVFIPKAGTAFAFEPVPHLSNALNRVGDEPAMPVIAPGELFEAEIVFAVVARPVRKADYVLRD
jgi:aldose 1-epimerase